MSDPLFNGRTYAENINFISDESKSFFDGGANSVGWFQNLLSSLQSEATSAGKSLDGFFAQFNENITTDAENRPTNKQLPKTWEAFITEFRRDYLEQDPPLPPETTANNTFANARDAFLAQSGHFESLGTTVFNAVSLEGAIIDGGEQFKRAFSDFLTHYPYNFGGGVGTSVEFFQNLRDYFGVISKVFDNFAGSGSTNLLDIDGTNIDDIITSYEEVFRQFPSPTETRFTTAGTPILVTPTFEETLGEFYKAYLAENGFFAVGRAFDEWSQKLQKEYSEGLQTSFAISPSGTTGTSRSTRALVTNKTNQRLFEGNIEDYVSFGTQDITQIANDVQATSSSLLNVTIQLLQTGSTPIDTSTDKFTFNENLIDFFTLNSDGTGEFFILFDQNTLQFSGRIENAINDAIQSFSLVSDSNIPATRIVLFTLNPPNEFPTTLRQEIDIASDYTIVNTSVTTDSSARVLVINRLFKLIAEMIDVIQQVAASQAQYLTFLTQWQKAYTDLISEVKTFTRSDGTVFGIVGDRENASIQTFDEDRNEVNSTNLTRRERLSNLRGVVSDTAKREQSRINQSQDAATQQGQFATSLIQQLSTILGAIYR